MRRHEGECFPRAVQAAIKDGRVEKGMTREQVLNLNEKALARYWRDLGLGDPKSWIMRWRDVLTN